MIHFWTSSLKKVQMCLQVRSVGIRVLHAHVIKLFQIFPIKKHQGNAVLNHHLSLFNTASPQFPSGLLPCVAVDLPFQPNIFMLTVLSPKPQPITTGISPKRHQSLSNSLMSPWRKLIKAYVH